LGHGRHVFREGSAQQAHVNGVQEAQRVGFVRGVLLHQHYDLGVALSLLQQLQAVCTQFLQNIVIMANRPNYHLWVYLLLFFQQRLQKGQMPIL
jgi:hypothetical protein